MIYGLLAQLILIVHVAYIIFAVFGGLGSLFWRKSWLIHIPALLWAFAVEFFSFGCPLTSLENRFRAAAGQSGYEAGFIDHFLTTMIYPGLPPWVHIAMGAGLVALNIAIYIMLYRKGVFAPAYENHEA